MFTNTAEFPVAGSVDRRDSASAPLRGLMTVLAAAVTLVALYLSNGLNDRVTQSLRASPITDFARRTSHGGLYRGEVAAAALRVGESDRWIIHLEQRNHRRLAHAAVRVRVWMPETGIESAVRPVATYVGGGNYRLDNVSLTRVGWWNVALVVDGKGGVDSLAFNLRLP